jgi:hypothetical protein
MKKSPRIYTYKVTFEEIPDWYWGAHKEKKYGEFYIGSPVTHAWKWEFYTPRLEIVELFPFTDEGWVEARKVEDRCILPDLNNPLCLNEHCGGATSLEIRRKVGKQQFQQSKGIHSPESRQKQREMMTRREVSEVTRERLSEALKGNKNCLGRIHTEETKQKIAEARKAQAPPTLGKKMSEDTKEKIRQSNLGKTRSEETKRKQSEAKKGVKRGPYKKRDKNG